MTPLAIVALVAIAAAEPLPEKLGCPPGTSLKDYGSETFCTDSEHRKQGLHRWLSRGVVRRETTFVDGEMTGPDRVYRPNGTMLMQTEMRDGLEHGLQRSYYADGQPMALTFYINGKRWGPSSTFENAGRLSSQGQYAADVARGVWLWFNDVGGIHFACEHGVERSTDLPACAPEVKDESGHPASSTLPPRPSVPGSKNDRP